MKDDSGFAEGRNRRHFGRPAIVQDRLWAFDDEALRFLSANPLFRGDAPFGEQRRAVANTVRIGGEQMHKAVV